MFVQYKPADGEARNWDFDPEQVFEDDAELIEKHSGANWDDFLDQLRSGQARARRVLLWHLIRQDHPKLAFADTPRFRMGELTVEFSSRELRQLIDEMAKVDRAGLDDDRRAELELAESRLQVALTDALLRERGEEPTAAEVAEPVGKADSPA